MITVTTKVITVARHPGCYKSPPLQRILVPRIKKVVVGVEFHIVTNLLVLVALLEVVDPSR